MKIYKSSDDFDYNDLRIGDKIIGEESGVTYTVIGVKSAEVVNKEYFADKALKEQGDKGISLCKEWFYTVEPKYKNCTREELDVYLENYPRPFEHDGFMGHSAFYDFSIAPCWPYALMIAIYNYEYEESDWKICTNAEEVYNSRILNHWAAFDEDKQTWVAVELGQ